MKLKHTLSAVAIATASMGVNASQPTVGPAHLSSPPTLGLPLWYQDKNGTVLDPHWFNANYSVSLQQDIIQAGSRNDLALTN